MALIYSAKCLKDDADRMKMNMKAELMAEFSTKMKENIEYKVEISMKELEGPERQDFDFATGKITRPDIVFLECTLRTDLMTYPGPRKKREIKLGD
jgi:hypothetical protein